MVHGKAFGLNCRENAQKSQNKAFDGRKGTRQNTKETPREAAKASGIAEWNNTVECARGAGRADWNNTNNFAQWRGRLPRYGEDETKFLNRRQGRTQRILLRQGFHLRLAYAGRRTGRGANMLGGI
jgi:hypothetical protein